MMFAMTKPKRFLDPTDNHQLGMLHLTLKEEAVGFDEISAALRSAIDEQAFADYIDQHPVLCPSTPAADDAFLFAVVDEQVELRYIKTPIPIDEGLAHALKKIDLPQRSFRFTHRCTECAHWQQERCSVATSVRRAAAALDEDGIPACGIRKHCRWFLQEGATICSLCQYTVTKY